MTNKFKVGDIVELIDNDGGGMSAAIGATAIVTDDSFGTLRVKWLDQKGGTQEDGGYYADRFKLKGDTMKAGDVVLIEGIVRVAHPEYPRIMIDGIELCIKVSSIKEVIPSYNVGDKVMTKDGTFSGTVEAVSADRKTLWVRRVNDYSTFAAQNVKMV